MPSARTEVAGTAWRGQLVVVGGLTGDGKASAEVHLYDPRKNEWQPAPDLPMALHHTSVVPGPENRLWVVGGYTIEKESWIPQDGVWSLGESDRAWRREASLSVARGALATAVVGDTLVSLGGATAGRGEPESVSRVVEFLSPDDREWERGPDLYDAREHLAAAATGDRVLAIGGRVGGIDTNLRSVESWAPGERAWRREPPLQKERGGFAAASVDGTPCVAGGEQPNRTISLVECLRHGQWRVVGQLSEPRHGLAVAALSGRLHVVAGGGKPGLFVSRTHEVLGVGR